MSIISKFILKNWYQSFLGAFAVLFLLITTADLINSLVQGKDIARVLLEYSLKLPEMFGRIFPICSLLASLFSINKLKNHSELTAILASGYSYKKIYTLVAGASLVIVSLQFLNLGFFESSINKIKRQEIEKTKKSEGKYLTRSGIEGGKFWYKAQDYFATFSYFDKKTNSLVDLEVFYFNDKHYGEMILSSPIAEFKNKAWIAKDSKIAGSLDGLSFPTLESKQNIDLSLSESPTDFYEFEADLTTLNILELNTFIKKMTKTGINISEYQVIVYNKIFLSLVCLVFALLPLSSVFNPNRRSSSFGTTIVLTLVIIVVFWVTYSSFVAFGNSGVLTPLVATGTIPVGLLLFSLFQLKRNTKLLI